MQNAALTIVTRNKVQDQDNVEILLVKRKDVPVWVLPGGGIEVQESPKEAAIRETYEESGLKTSIVRHIATYHPINRLAAPIYLFLCQPVDFSDPNISSENEEVSAAAFFSVKNLPSTIFPLHKTFIHEWLQANVLPFARPLSEITYFSLLKLTLLHPIFVFRYLFAKAKRKLTHRMNLLLLLSFFFLLPSNLAGEDVSMQDLSIEQKVGQLLLVHFHGEEANEHARTLIQDIGVGGIVYLNVTNTLSSAQKVAQLSAGLQALAAKTHSHIPLLLAADQEGGVVARLTNGFTVFPGNKALGMAKSPELVYQSALAMGKELHSVGVNITLAPVVDVNSNPRNPVIGVRSFSERASEVSSYAREALRGFHEAHVATTLKHFPGHGDVDIDSHLDLPTSTKPLDRLEQEDLLPFYDLSTETDAIMTAHMVVNALDPTCCATLSPKILNLLRKEKNFPNIIMSDSLNMDGLLKSCSPIEEAAVRAFEAGCDILLLSGIQFSSNGGPNREVTPDDAKRIHAYIVQAVKNGRISMERLDESVSRVLLLKKKYALPVQDSSPAIGTSVSTQEHRDLAQKIARLALRTDGQLPSLSRPLQECNVGVFAPKLLGNTIKETQLSSLGKKTCGFLFETLSPSPDEHDSILEQAKKVDLCIFCSYNAWKNPAQKALVQSLLVMKKPVIIIASRDPLDTTLFHKGSYVISTFSPTQPSMQAASELIVEKFSKAS